MGQLHEPPHPSGPQNPVMHVDSHVHLPFLHVFPGGQLPHVPEHPSDPHSFSEQSGSHVHLPFLHVFPGGQLPHVPEHPSDPHSFSEQVGEHFFFLFKRNMVMVTSPEKMRKGIINFFQFIYLMG